MKNLIVNIILLSFLFVSCDCGIDAEELLFTENELKNFSSFAVGDTIVYSSNSGNSDTIIVKEISATIKEFDIECGILSAQPSNYKSIHILNHPVNKYPYSHWETDSTAETKDLQWFMSMNVTPNPRKVKMTIGIKNFSFSHGNYQDFKIEKDTVIGGYNLNSFYKFPHSYPERMKDSNFISTIYWTPKLGLVAYSNLNGEIFIKN